MSLKRIDGWFDALGECGPLRVFLLKTYHAW